MRSATLTQWVLADLCGTPRGTTSELAAEVTGVLRFAGRFQMTAGTPELVVDVGSDRVAARLRRAISELYGLNVEVRVPPRPGTGRDGRHLVRITAHALHLARQTGLVDSRGRTVRGIPPAVVSGSVGDVAALWRGAFLACGSLTEPSRSPLSLELACPRPEVALALVGAARRLATPAKARETRDGVRVVVRDADAVTQLLTRMGAGASVARWQERRTPLPASSLAARVGHFDQANLRRSGDAAARTTARVARALEILGGDIPEHLLTVARLRLRYEADPLERLGQRADPPLTKDAIAGRLRRLVATADAIAHALGIPDTEAALRGRLTRADGVRPGPLEGG